VYARRQFCADLEVYRPPEPLWNPRLREAATTLGVMQKEQTKISKKLCKKVIDFQEYIVQVLITIGVISHDFMSSKIAYFWTKNFRKNFQKIQID